MYRYGFVLAALAIGAVAAAAFIRPLGQVQGDQASAPTAASAQAVAEGPNVLIILTDDHPVRNDFYSVMPETMRIFREGGRHYTNGVATTPLCCPARTSLFSGQYVHNHGVIGNIAPGRFDPSTTMQRELRAAGYYTALSGKFLNEWNSAPPDFDKWAMMLGQSRYSNVDFNVNGQVVNQPGYTTTVIRDFALGFLDDFEAADDARPWFMEVAPLAPHGPATPEKQFAGVAVPVWKDNAATNETDLTDKPAYVRAQGVTKRSTQVFRSNQARTLKSVDVLVSRIFDRLVALGEAENTLAFFLGDHGHMLWEYQLRGKKYPYNQTIRSPFFVRWPGHMAPGSVSSDIVANIDVAPTVYQAAGIAPSYVMDGKTLGSTPPGPTYSSSTSPTTRRSRTTEACGPPPGSTCATGTTASSRTSKRPIPASTTDRTTPGSSTTSTETGSPATSRQTRQSSTPCCSARPPAREPPAPDRLGGA